MKYIGFCGASGSGKTTLRASVTCEMERAALIKDRTCYDYTKQSFATPLKEFCVTLLGLTEEQVYGKDKHTLTRYTWGQMPNYVDPNVCRYTGNTIFKADKVKSKLLMTAQEVMQWWGTDVFRDTNPDMFLTSLKGRVESQNVDVYIDDVRFTNEAALCDILIHVVSGDTPESLHESEQQYKTLNPHLSINTRQLGLEVAAKQVCEFLRERLQ